MIQEYDLHDVLNNDIPLGDGPEQFGFHLIHHFGDGYAVQPDGYAGTIDQIHTDGYDDVLELVKDLNTYQLEFWYETDEDGREEWAGPLMTREWEREHGIDPDTDEILNVDRVEDAFENDEMGIECNTP